MDTCGLDPNPAYDATVVETGIDPLAAPVPAGAVAADTTLILPRVPDAEVH